MGVIVNRDDLDILIKNRRITGSDNNMPVMGDLSSKSPKTNKLTPEQMVKQAKVEEAKNRINLGYDDEGGIF